MTNGEGTKTGGATRAIVRADEGEVRALVAAALPMLGKDALHFAGIGHDQVGLSVNLDMNHIRFFTEDERATLARVGIRPGPDGWTWEGPVHRPSLAGVLGAVAAAVGPSLMPIDRCPQCRAEAPFTHKFDCSEQRPIKDAPPEVLALMPPIEPVPSTLDAAIASLAHYLMLDPEAKTLEARLHVFAGALALPRQLPIPLDVNGIPIPAPIVARLLPHAEGTETSADTLDRILLDRASAVHAGREREALVAELGEARTTAAALDRSRLMALDAQGRAERALAECEEKRAHLQHRLNQANAKIHGGARMPAPIPGGPWEPEGVEGPGDAFGQRTGEAQ